jgi:hypothetical protein
VEKPKRNWSIIVDPEEGVVVPVIIPVVALIAIASMVISISHLGMKHRERLEKIRQGAINK